MTIHSWSALKRSALRQLAQACPVLMDRPMVAVRALVTCVALAEVRLTASPIAGSLKADLQAHPVPRNDPQAEALLDEIAGVISDHACQPRPPSGADFAARLGGQHGFTELMADLLAAGAPQEELSAVAALVGTAIRGLSERVRTLAIEHLHAILARDLPQASFLRFQLTTIAAWLLAPEISGQRQRSEVVKRRLQALTAYGALSITLRDPDLTAAIDGGSPLASLLMDRHRLSPAELRALRDARTLRRAIEDPLDFRFALAELKAHDVPLCEWPGNGRPARPEAWEGCAWLKPPRQHFIRPDYIGEQKDGVLDAISALLDDLLRPLVAERLRAGAFPHTGAITHFARGLELEGADGGNLLRRRFMAAIRSAVVGPRRPKAFREAVAVWHRRVASLSALRHERQVDRPGWPPLCAPWRSGCGRFEIVILVSAAELVEEGRQLDHCVGGYYDICRRGDTQILSLREEGRRVATIEIRLGDNLDAVTLQVGQFQARRNTSPPPHLHQPLRDFLRALRGGAWRGEALPIGHAREVFHLYLSLPPRGTPPDFDEWCKWSHLSTAVDEVLTFLATATPPASANSSPTDPQP